MLSELILTSIIYAYLLWNIWVDGYEGLYFPTRVFGLQVGKYPIEMQRTIEEHRIFRIFFEVGIYHLAISLIEDSLDGFWIEDIEHAITRNRISKRDIEESTENIGYCPLITG